MNYWLTKTEEDVYPIEQLKKDKSTPWDGIRNYQARNFLMDMKKGDIVFIYHSNTDTPGIVGTATVLKEAEPDELQFDKKSKYYDPKATKDKPRWYAPVFKYKKTFPQKISLQDLKNKSYMKNSRLLTKGNRLSVMPISTGEANGLLNDVS